MPIFKAVNKIDLLFPGDFNTVHKIRRLRELPEDYDELPFLHERTDKMEPTGRLEIQDTIILVIERPGFHDYYEICAIKGMGRQNK